MYVVLKKRTVFLHLSEILNISLSLMPVFRLNNNHCEFTKHTEKVIFFFLLKNWF